MIVKGQKINDRYEIIRNIGEGGMANVYLAHDTILDRDVAVKVLRGDLANDEKFVRRFQREAISASSLSHPNIVEMYDVGEDNGQYYIVMEYVDGKTLKTLIKKRGALTLPEVIDIMLQLTSGIAHAHDSYIVHRDIKPQNVMILDNGMIKITDFGIAMALNSHELTQTNSVMGSVHYLPPEQANGTGSTTRSDVYSLGILMFELLTGKVPFRGENAVEIAIKQMKEQMPNICEINQDIPRSVENIILKATAKNPKNRYESAHEMRDDIISCLEPSRLNEPRYVYPYPEHETEDTQNLSKTRTWAFGNKGEVDTMANRKKTTNVLSLMIVVFLSMTILIAGVAIIYPTLVRTPEVKIPDITNMTLSEAEDKLSSIGLNVLASNKSDQNVPEGKVISTSPEIGNTVKKGRTITIYISSGAKTFTLEDYVGKSSLEIKGMLVASGLRVLVEKKDVDDPSQYDADTIIEQFPAKDTKLTDGDTVTLYVANIVTKYPDFVGENWSIDDVQLFANQYNLSLTIDYVENADYVNGKIISQSRLAGSEITSPSYFKIVVVMNNSSDVQPGV